jgi:hypothetical protein
MVARSTRVAVICCAQSVPARLAIRALCANQPMPIVGKIDKG